MEDKNLIELINGIFNKYTKMLWLTPHYCRKMITSEDLPKLKKELITALRVIIIKGGKYGRKHK